MENTIFPLDARHCLILSNQEFVENPSPTTCFKPRTNPRSFGFTFFSPLHVVRGRRLTPDQVWSINFILKKRALRYIAAQEEEWLDPETQLPSSGWARLDLLLRPKKVTLIKSIRAHFSDGRQVAMDRLGRPIRTRRSSSRWTSSTGRLGSRSELSKSCWTGAHQGAHSLTCSLLSRLALIAAPGL